MNDVILPRLRNLMAERGIDAALAYGGANFMLSTGFQNYFDNPAASMALIPASPSVHSLMIVSNWTAEAGRAAAKVDVIESFPLWLEIADIADIRNGTAGRSEKPTRFDPEANIQRLATAILERGWGRGTIAVEMALISAQVFDWMRKKLPDVTFVNGADLFFEARKIKTAAEVEMLREATRYAEGGLKCIAETPIVGFDVARLKLVYDEFCNERAKANPDSGFQGTRVTASIGADISPTVIGGAKASAETLVFFDCGASIRGYGSDTGRTLTLQPPTQEARDIMDALKRGMDAAFALVRPGARLADIFHAGQDAVRASGLDWYSRGHIGHAMGIGMGEMPPFIGPKDNSVLEVGMVMALETPLYVRGLGGFQIEECFVVTETGFDLLTSLPRDFLPATA
ncbi:M24 family metallopeptidase [Rhizobium sp.]